VNLDCFSADSDGREAPIRRWPRRLSDWLPSLLGPDSKRIWAVSGAVETLPSAEHVGNLERFGPLSDNISRRRNPFVSRYPQ
jgi:hypothetical protein